uniref:7-carboxy-7-deazaguanine synthase n=1 Tax=Polynucleobacter necessarius subsp. necessarius (strain STIR1) TaxID=452638 RepID=B1XTX4_POLNS
MYTVKEPFPILQGEGAHAGRAAVFCRFAGCNLWSGREEDRGAAICQFCDTDFVGSDGLGGGKFETANALADAIESSWRSTSAGPQQRYVVFTGGEPLLQLDDELIAALHQKGFAVAIETNGTIKIPKGIDWVCVSPKAGSELIVLQADELKLVVPQQDHSELEKIVARFEKMDYRNRFLQPMDGPGLKSNTELAVSLC